MPINSKAPLAGLQKVHAAANLQKAAAASFLPANLPSGQSEATTDTPFQAGHLNKLTFGDWFRYIAAP